MSAPPPPDPFAAAPTDSRYGPVADHARQYAASGGADGHDWNGAPTLLLTTLGRRSSLPRRTTLIYGCHHDAYIVVASNLGADLHPDWYLNLRHHAAARIQVHGQLLAVHARTATPAEQPLLWDLMAGIWPDYDAYQRATQRPIPTVVLQPDFRHMPAQIAR
uniref:nitroreductase family deazaflavin-dependent oxidoreductase n=1 Tax=Streptomyces chartreusis TaxID=1969 RepID=UPI003F497364